MTLYWEIPLCTSCMYMDDYLNIITQWCQTLGIALDAGMFIIYHSYFPGCLRPSNSYMKSKTRSQSTISCVWVVTRMFDTSSDDH